MALGSRLMSKKVISFRLSEKDLGALDQACKSYKMNRSDILSAAIGVFLRDYVPDRGSYAQRAPWRLDILDEKKK